MIRTAVLGLARIGRDRELETALEATGGASCPTASCSARSWDEVVPALEHLVAAARQRRAADVQSLDVTVGL